MRRPGGTQAPLWRRLLWFAALWLAGLACVGILAGLLRFWLRP
ncbi:MAG TPA: DUF2474 domain-containing protein [Pseudoxanthomonas sp.]|nr:DUF2474 domain-containing protein [Pseudoxanthomonas sp.]